MPRVAVIGAGVIGLSSALHVLEQCPSTEVNVFAEHFSPNTTTNVAAGIWRPLFTGNTRKDSIRKWSGTTLEHMLHLARSNLAKQSGVSIVSGYDLSHKETSETPVWADNVKNFRHLGQDELVHFPGMRSGYFFTTACLDPAPYLEYLTKRLMNKRVRLMKRRFSNLGELSEEGYDVIVNCTGLGARELVNDKGMQPIRGQVIRIKAPWMKHFYLMTSVDRLCYIIPGTSYVVVGGTQAVGDENTSVSQEDKQQIWEGCTKYAPNLTEATIISDHVGLRPGRPATVRLEQEVLQINEKPQIVVHNYGHGGGGLTLHWGCAEDAAILVKKALETSHSKSRL